MWVDYLHSFYRMPCKLVIGGVPTTVTLRWYKAPAGAQRLPFGSAIFSHVWDNNPGESIPGEIGEVGAPRTWDPGNNVGYQGQCYRGDPTWFQTGQLPALAGIPASPCLCQIPPAFGSGTLVLGGSGVPSDVFTCQPKGLTLHAVLFHPLGPQYAMTANTPGDDSQWYVHDPVYPFYWRAVRVFVACRGSGASWTFGASLGITGVFNVFRCGCLNFDGTATGQWRVPFTSPYYAGMVAGLFASGP